MLASPSIAKALIDPVETTLRQLMLEYGWGDEGGYLENLGKLTQAFQTYAVRIEPAVGVGNLDTPRVISRRAISDDYSDDIATGEGPEIEF